MSLDVAEAGARRLQRVGDDDSDHMLQLLLANYQRVTADPRKMGYLRFLLKHYAKSPTPWRDCMKDNLKRFGPKTPGLCVAPTTPVSTSAGLVEIADLRPGDLVWSFDGEQFVLKPVLWSGLTRKQAPVVRVEVEDEVELLVTPDHPLLRYCGEWAGASDLQCGDFLLGPLFGCVGSCGFPAASGAVPFSLPDPASADAQVQGPRMSIGAMRSVFDLSAPSFDELVFLEDLSDLLLSSRGHQGFDDAHDGDGWPIVDAPLESGPTSFGFCFQFAGLPQPEGANESLQWIREILCGDDARVPTASAVGLLAARTVEAKASFSFEEPGSVSDVLGREITKVSLLEKRIDVWDIEVADTHNFVVHDFIIAHNCGVLKDIIRQRTDWRHGSPAGPHPGHPDAGSPGVAIGEADASAAPPFGGHHKLKLADDGCALDRAFADEFGEHIQVPHDVLELVADIAANCNVKRVLLELDQPPVPVIA